MVEPGTTLTQVEMVDVASNVEFGPLSLPELLSEAL